MALGRLGQAHTTQAVGNNGIVVDIQRMATDRQTVELSPTHPGTDSLLNEVGFQLGDAGDNGQKQPSHRLIGRDVLSPRNELDSEAVQFFDNTEEVFGRTR
jgi:hypothetical protein